MVTDPEVLSRLNLRASGFVSQASTTPPQEQVRILAIGGLGGEFLAPAFVGNYLKAMSSAWRRLWPNSEFRILQPTIAQSMDVAAELIATELSAQPDSSCILFGHSKGGVDILECLVRYPEVRGKVHSAILANSPLQGSWVADFLRDQAQQLPLFRWTGILNATRAAGWSWSALLDVTTERRQEFWTEQWDAMPFADRQQIASLLTILTCRHERSRQAAWPIILPHWLMQQRGIPNDGLVATASQRPPLRPEFARTRMLTWSQHHGYLTCSSTLSRITDLERTELLRQLTQSNASEAARRVRFPISQRPRRAGENSELEHAYSI
ncbi:MAG TPA: hypothetical protein PLZ57_00300 [Pseudobdellovibrionaceae bacterium]|nr:hypothetical protein [Pseudobdellovibrionaceae bacterium]